MREGEKVRKLVVMPLVKFMSSSEMAHTFSAVNKQDLWLPEDMFLDFPK